MLHHHPQRKARPELSLSQNDVDFRDLKRSDVTRLLDGIQEKHGARQADVVLAIVRKMMNWHATRVDDYRSPVVQGMNRSNGDDRKRKRFLDDNEIKAFCVHFRHAQARASPARTAPAISCGMSTTATPAASRAERLDPYVPRLPATIAPA